MRLIPSRAFQVINIVLLLLVLLLGYQNCAGRVEGDPHSAQHDLPLHESWELLVTSESGDVVFENQSVHLSVNSARSLKDAKCQWTHERKGQTTSFETPDCSLSLEAVTPDDEGLYSTRVTLPDGDSILLGPVLLKVTGGATGYPEISNVLAEYSIEKGEEATIVASANEDVDDGSCEVQWKNLDHNESIGCGLKFDLTKATGFGEYQVEFKKQNLMHVKYFTLQNKSHRAPASLSCGHRVGRVADLISETRTSFPEGYVGEFGDFRWTIARFDRETADRLCSLADSRYTSADGVFAEEVDFQKSSLPVMNVRRFDPTQGKWASVCSHLQGAGCPSQWIIQGLTCCKSP